MNIQEIPIDSIHVAKDRQLMDASTVPALAESIKSIGLQAPLGVRANGDGHSLVWGWKRLQAVKSLGWKVVPASIVTLDDLHAALAEIDENLCRAELTAAQRSKQLAKRKELYESLHPETKKGAQGGGKNGKGTRKRTESDKMSFSEDTAAKTGKSKRTVERAVKVGEKLADDALFKLGSHPIANNQAELAKLAEYTAKEQAEIVVKLNRGQLQRVPEKEQPKAKPAAKPSKLPIEQQFRPVYDALGKFKRELDSLMRQSDHPNYKKIIAMADQQSDLLTEWKESRL